MQNEPISGMCTPRTREISCVPAALLCISTALLMNVAHADDQDVLTLEAGVLQTVDNNLFRLPASVDPFAVGAAGHERGDSITASHAGFTVDQPIGSQKFHLEGFETFYDYKNYSFLNGSTTNFLASWQLALTSALTGKLSTQRTELPASFIYYQTYNRRDILTSNSTDLTLDWSPTQTLHLTTDLADRQFIDSTNNKQIASFDNKFIEVGLLYAFPSSATIGAYNDRTLGTYRDQVLDYADQLDTGFSQNEDKLVLIWPVTSKMQVDAQAGYVKRDNDHFSSRNYSGTTGSLSLNYGLLDSIYVTGILPSGYTELPLNFGVQAGFNRSYSPYVNNDESYMVVDKSSVQLLYTPTPKINLKFGYEHNRDNFFGAITGNILNTKRFDTFNVSTFELDWNPIKSVALAAIFSREQRQSTAPVNSPGCLFGCDYNDNSVSVSMVYKY